MFLLVKAKYFCYSFFNLSIEIFFLYLDRLLVRQKKHLVPLAIVIGFVLSSALGVSGILGIRDSHAAARLTIKVNGLLTASTWGHLVSVSLNIVP
jgi:hypothetical protein